jgi:TetR/AcrR family transcriptional regulator, copper-responsive repressor
VESSPASAARRGRPRSFDIDAVTASALRVLWRQGYDATSIEELVEATGLSPSSLYGTFGSKRGLLQAALERYDRDRDAALGPLAEGTGGLDDAVAFVAHVRSFVAAADGPGCLMVNTMTEVSPRAPDIADRTHRYQERIRTSLHAALTRAGTLGEIDPATAEDRARLVQAGLFGAQVAARAGATGEALAALDALEREIRRWGPARLAPGGGARSRPGSR